MHKYARDTRRCVSCRIPFFSVGGEGFIHDALCSFAPRMSSAKVLVVGYCCIQMKLKFTIFYQTLNSKTELEVLRPKKRKVRLVMICVY